MRLILVFLLALSVSVVSVTQAQQGRTDGPEPPERILQDPEDPPGEQGEEPTENDSWLRTFIRDLELAADEQRIALFGLLDQVVALNDSDYRVGWDALCKAADSLLYQLSTRDPKTGQPRGGRVRPPALEGVAGFTIATYNARNDLEEKANKIARGVVEIRLRREGLYQEDVSTAEIPRLVASGEYDPARVPKLVLSIMATERKLEQGRTIGYDAYIQLRVMAFAYLPRTGAMGDHTKPIVAQSFAQIYTTNARWRGGRTQTFESKIREVIEEQMDELLIDYYKANLRKP